MKNVEIDGYDWFCIILALLSCSYVILFYEKKEIPLQVASQPNTEACYHNYPITEEDLYSKEELLAFINAKKDCNF